MPVIQRYEDAETLARAAAELFASTVRESDSANRPAFIAVSGGSTPRRMFELLAGADIRDGVPWGRLQLFWVDERFVPSDHPESNYRMTREALLDHVDIPPANVHRIPTELASPEEAADAYEAELRSLLPRSGSGWPRFDLVLLGMGADGHTASLFPGSSALSEQSRWACANRVPSLEHSRVTLTFPAVNHAALVAFVVSGSDKADRLKEVLDSPKDAARLPAQGIEPVDGSLLWLADEAALARP